jgi:hypothetical protein
MLAILRAIDSRSRDCGNDEVWLWRAPTSAISRAIDSCSKDCGNDGFYFVISYLGLSSWKFRRGEITTLIRPAEIIRDLQRAQMLAMLCAVDSRSKDCGNDGSFVLCGADVQPTMSSSRKFRGAGINPFDAVGRNYPGSTECANASHFTRGRFPLKRPRE